MKRPWMRTYFEPPQQLGELFDKPLSIVPVLAEQLNVPDTGCPSGIVNTATNSGEARESTTTTKTPDRMRKQPDSRGGAQDICQNRHKGNPESRKAFQSLKDRLSEQQRRVLNAIRNSGGLTVDEIAQKLGVTPNMVSGRASELKRDGKIRKSGTRLTRSGNSAAILVAV